MAQDDGESAFGVIAGQSVGVTVRRQRFCWILSDSSLDGLRLRMTDTGAMLLSSWRSSHLSGYK